MFSWEIFLLFAITQFAECIKLTKFEVPEFADPREETELLCEWELSGEPLQSVKWFRNDQEFFQYRPEVTNYYTYYVPGLMEFTGDCDLHKCKMILRVRAELGSARYKCEVSGERPRFVVAHEEKTLSVLARPEKEPEITGKPEIVQPDQDIVLNCTSYESLPAADITWYINRQPANISRHDMVYTSGLWRNWATVALRLGGGEALLVECRAQQRAYGRDLPALTTSLVLAEPLAPDADATTQPPGDTDESSRAHSSTISSFSGLFLIASTFYKLLR